VGELALALFWPAVLAYGEAAVVYLGAATWRSTLSRFAIWGVRIGWLAQAALLVAQALAAEGFPWTSPAASLNLFVWMCVGIYLIWGCRPPYRLLGLAVMPLAAVLLAVAWAAGGVDVTRRSDLGTAFLVAHVGLVVAAFAGFTISAGVAGVYLWQQRRLKRHTPGVLRLRLPGLTTLDGLVARTITASLVALTLGAGVGFARIRSEGHELDAIAITTIATWAFYAGYVVARHELGWTGRRSAQLALAGFALVVAVRLGLMPVGHF
jgi:ABC-type uncharacterized transport system permease subunit